MDRLAGDPRGLLDPPVVLKINEFTVDPHRRSFQPDELEQLDKQLDQAGKWLNAAVVRAPGTGYVLMMGERRVAARMHGGSRQATVYILNDWQQLLAWMILDDQDEGPKKRMLLDEVAQLSRKIKKYFRITRYIPLDETLGELTGYSKNHIRETRYLMERAEEHPVGSEVRRYGEQQARLVGDGAVKPSSAFERLNRFISAGEAAANAPSPARQRQILNTATQALAGVTEALETLGPLSDTLTGGERAAWEKSLVEVQGRLIRTLRAIRGRDHK